jgi:hypothetical protein
MSSMGGVAPKRQLKSDNVFIKKTQNYPFFKLFLILKTKHL